VVRKPYYWTLRVLAFGWSNEYLIRGRIAANGGNPSALHPRDWVAACYFVLMDGIHEEGDRQEVIEMLGASPKGGREGKRTSLPLDGAPAWYNGEDDEGYTASAAMTMLGRVSR
jgi:hypothetical protein